MLMRKKSKRRIWFLNLMIMCMAIVTLIMMQETAWFDMVLNLFFLAVMAILIHGIGMKGIGVMNRIADDCGRITKKITDMAGLESGERLWNRVKNNPEFQFSDEIVNSAWKEYCSKSIPDSLDDYINEELVYERGKKGQCDMIPGLLTAVGILGTFLGLIISMKSWSFNDPSAMEQTLENIVGGINVAFYTSVYGVILSILYNLVYRAEIQDINDSLYGLHDIFRKKLSGLRENDADKQYLRYLDEEQKILCQIETAIEEELPDNIGDVFAKSVGPVFEQINTSLKRVIGDFRQEQSASLQNIVSSFVEQMRLGLDSHINDLGASVDCLSRSQAEMTRELKALLGEIENTAKDTKKINKESDIILSKLEAYLDKINTMVEMTHKTYQMIEAYTVELHQTVREQGQVVSGLEAHETGLLETCRIIKEVEDSFVAQSNASLVNAEHIREQQNSFIENQEYVLRALTEYGQKMFENVTELKAVQLSASVEYRNYWKAFEVSQQAQNEKWEQMYTLLESVGKMKENDSDGIQIENQGEMLDYQKIKMEVDKMLYEYLKREKEKEERKWRNRLRRSKKKF